MNLEPSSKQPSKTPSLKGLAWLLALFSLAGFLDATYLAVKYYLASPLECSLLAGCDVVTSSAYATVGPVPVSLPGLLYYLTVFLLTVYYLDKKDIRSLKLAMFVTPLGLLASIWFVYLQVFVIKALCLYCLISAGTSTLLFVTAIFGFWQLRKNLNGEAPEQI